MRNGYHVHSLQGQTATKKKKAHVGHKWWSWGLNSSSSFALHSLCLSNNERAYIINFMYNQNIACIKKRLQIIPVEPGAFL